MQRGMATVLESFRKMRRQRLKHLGALVLLTACTEPRTPDEEGAYRRCLAAVEAEREQVADRLCPDTWDGCPHRARIMAEFAAAQRRCR
jgi:hypothetical protein